MIYEKERRSNIELLRILSMVGVIILHYNNPSMGGGLKYVSAGSFNQSILYFFESLFICAVDIFIIITGFFLYQQKKCNIWKSIDLLIQVILFNTGIYFLQCLLNIKNFTMFGFFKEIIPDNWSIILYIVLISISPYINMLVTYLEYKDYKSLLVVLMILFSIYPTCVDFFSEITNIEWIGLSSIGAYGSQYGYSIINFILLYLIGGYLHKFDIKKSNKTLCVFLLILIFAITGWAKLNDIIGYSIERTAWEYCNPLVILEAVIIFLIFNNIQMKTKKYINMLAKGAFSVYLLHSVFIKKINIEVFVNDNFVILIAHILFTSIFIYLCCWIVYWLYSKTIMMLLYKIEEKVYLPEIRCPREKTKI